MEELPLEVVDVLMSHLPDNALAALTLMSSRVGTMTGEIKSNNLYWLGQISRLYDIPSIGIVEGMLGGDDPESVYKALALHSRYGNTEMLANNPAALSIALSHYNGYLNAGKILRDASRSGNLESVKILLESGKIRSEHIYGGYDTLNRRRDGAIDIAKENNHLDVVEMLESV